VLTLTEATIGYPDKTLANDISLILRRVECLGVIGPNRVGKTTFVKRSWRLLSCQESALGSKVQIGYYAQQLED